MRYDEATAGDTFSLSVLDKGNRLFREGKVRQDAEHPHVFWVGSGSGGTREYRVEVHRDYASCTCRHGLNAGSAAHCCHPVAVMAWAKEHGQEDVIDPPEEEEEPGHPYPRCPS